MTGNVIQSDALYQALLDAGIVHEPLNEACSFAVYGRVGLPVIVEICKWGDDRLLRVADLWKQARIITEQRQMESGMTLCDTCHQWGLASIYATEGALCTACANKKRGI